MKTLQCRAHGGTFKIGPKRGRDPVNCGGPWPTCTRDPGETRTESPLTEARRTNPSVVAAMAVKNRLGLQGWECKGKGFFNEDGGAGAELLAVRGEEMLVMYWLDGDCTLQEYTLWHPVSGANGKPDNSLTFNPDECTDRELVRALAGMKCTWWNVLGQKTEEAIIAPESIKIEHAYNGLGDEAPGDRIVKFIEHGGAGFRAFRVSALLKVG